MASASDYLETAILDHITGNAAYAQPGVLYVALFTDAASDADLEQGILTNEAAGINYQRKSVVFGAAVQNQSNNVTDVIFNQAGAGGWGTVDHVAIMDSFTNGNILFHKQLGTPQPIADGDQLKFNIDNLTITMT